MNTASPGRTSRSSSKPTASSATLSDATMCSTPFAVSRMPSTSGRMPCGSRNATRPVADDHRDDRVAARAALVQRFDGVEDLLRLQAVLACLPSSCANTLSSTSESELVFRWRWSCCSTSRFSSSALTRLPLCARQMPYGELT